MLVVGLFSTSFLVSCDSGGGSDSGSQTDLELPDDSSAGNNEQTGVDADNSGADETLEASYGDQVFDGINSERASRGLAALTRDSQMDSLAAAHNDDMISRAIANGTIISDHANAQSRADAIFARGFTAFGENTGGIRGYSSSVVASTFVTGWVNSPGHLENIIGDYTTTGVAVTVDPRDGTIFSTQIFTK